MGPQGGGRENQVGSPDATISATWNVWSRVPFCQEGTGDDHSSRVRWSIAHGLGLRSAKTRSSTFCSSNQANSSPRIVPVDEANLSVSMPNRWSIETNRLGRG